MAMHMAEKNRQAGQDLDRIFMQRKQREQETAQVHALVAGDNIAARHSHFPVTQIDEQIEGHYRAVQARINELEPGRLRAYTELQARQREFQERVLHSENRLNDINAQVEAQ